MKYVTEYQDLQSLIYHDQLSVNMLITRLTVLVCYLGKESELLAVKSTVTLKVTEIDSRDVILFSNQLCPSD